MFYSLTPGSEHSNTKGIGPTITSTFFLHQPTSATSLKLRIFEYHYFHREPSELISDLYYYKWKLCNLNAWSSSPSPSCFLFDKYNSTGGLKSAWHDRKTLEATQVRENKSYFLAAKAATSREEAEQRIIRGGHVARDTWWHGASGPDTDLCLVTVHKESSGRREK